MSRIDAAGVRGYLVHAYTASTLLFVAVGMQWIIADRFQLALLAMAATIVIDATDGALARKYRVKETASLVEGELLDNLVDFVSYVVLPVLFMLETQMLIVPEALWVTLIMFASVFGFSRTDAKIADKGFFVGFPSYWNIVVFYLFLLDTNPLFNTVLLLLLASSVFVPLRFLYLTRLKRRRALYFGLASLWGAVCLWALLLEPGTLRSVLLYSSLAYVVFYTVHSLLADLADRRGQAQQN